MHEIKQQEQHTTGLPPHHPEELRKVQAVQEAQAQADGDPGDEQPGPTPAAAYPTIEDFVARGYLPENYPPQGCPEAPSPGLTRYREFIASYQVPATCSVRWIVDEGQLVAVMQNKGPEPAAALPPIVDPPNDGHATEVAPEITLGDASPVADTPSVEHPDPNPAVDNSAAFGTDQVL